MIYWLFFVVLWPTTKYSNYHVESLTIWGAHVWWQTIQGQEPFPHVVRGGMCRALSVKVGKPARKLHVNLWKKIKKRISNCLKMVVHLMSLFASTSKVATVAKEVPGPLGAEEVALSDALGLLGFIICFIKLCESCALSRLQIPHLFAISSEITHPVDHYFPIRRCFLHDDVRSSKRTHQLSPL